MSNLGMGVMLNMLGGNEDTVNALKASLNKKIKLAWLDQEADRLKIRFDDDSVLSLWDAGQSCCEHRYMRTDDNLNDYTGHTLIDIELKNAPDEEDEYGEVHEVQFLEIKTDKGVFTMSNHNEHNGYYGGFAIVASL